MHFVLFHGSSPHLDGNRIEAICSFQVYKHPGLAGVDRASIEEFVRELLLAGEAPLINRGLKATL
jgi:hypothetical protein